MFFSLLAISTLTTVAVIKVASARRKKNAKKQLLQPVKPLQPGSSIQQLEDRCQEYIEHKFDRLMGDGRKQQLQQLSADTPVEIPEGARKDNRYLVATGVNAGVSFALGVIAPPLLVLTAPVCLYFCARHFRDAWRGLMYERRITISAVDATSVVIALAAGYWRCLLYTSPSPRD